MRKLVLEKFFRTAMDVERRFKEGKTDPHLLVVGDWPYGAVLNAIEQTEKLYSVTINSLDDNYGILAMYHNSARGDFPTLVSVEPNGEYTMEPYHKDFILNKLVDKIKMGSSLFLSIAGEDVSKESVEAKLQTEEVEDLVKISEEFLDEKNTAVRVVVLSRLQKYLDEFNLVLSEKA